MSDKDFVPEEIEDQCTECHRALGAVERLVKPVLSVNKSQLEDKLTPLDSVSLILLLMYTTNSLFWVYLAGHGINPKTHPIKGELERIQKAMQRVKSVSESQTTGGVRLNKESAKRFIRGALWDSNSGPLNREAHSTDDSNSRKRNVEDVSNSPSPQAKRTHLMFD